MPGSPLSRCGALAAFLPTCLALTAGLPPSTHIRAAYTPFRAASPRCAQRYSPFQPLRWLFTREEQPEASLASDPAGDVQENHHPSPVRSATDHTASPPPHVSERTDPQQDTPEAHLAEAAPSPSPSPSSPRPQEEPDEATRLARLALTERDQARRARLALAERDALLERKRRAADAWGEQQPAATDWLRRDAAELMWQRKEMGEAGGVVSALRQAWGEEDRLPADLHADDWRLDEFEQLLEREKGWRKAVYSWWLKVWDAAGDDYLFEPDETDDYGFPKTRLDGTPWDEAPLRARRSFEARPEASRPRLRASVEAEFEERLAERRGARESWREEGGEGGRKAVEAPRPTRERAAAGRSVEVDAEWEERVAERRGRGRQEDAVLGEREKETERRERDRLEMKSLVEQEEREKAKRRGERDGAESLEESVDEEAAIEPDGMKNHRPLRRRAWREESEGPARATDRLDEYDSDEEYYSRPRRKRRDAERWDSRSLSGDAYDSRYRSVYDDSYGFEEERPRRRRRQSQSEFIEARLERLLGEVELRIDQLEEADRDLEKRRAEVCAEIAALDGDQELDAWQITDSVATQMPPSVRARQLHTRRLDQERIDLQERRMRTWDATELAEERVLEIRFALRALRSGGVDSLRDVVDRREVSRNLRTFLERWL